MEKETQNMSDHFNDNVNMQLLEDLAYALTNHDSWNTSFSATYVDLTEGTIITLLNEEELGHDDMSMIPQWQKEALEDSKEYKKHDLILITPIPSIISFRVMEDFADACSPKQQAVLLSALGKNHPFSQFRQSVERLGILESWYDYKHKGEFQMTEKWLCQNDLTIKDGKIVRCANEGIE